MAIPVHTTVMQQAENNSSKQDELSHLDIPEPQLSVWNWLQSKTQVPNQLRYGFINGELVTSVEQIASVLFPPSAYVIKQCNGNPEMILRAYWR
jgi:hypothetical protein